MSVQLLQLSAQTAPSPIVSPPVPSGIAMLAITLAVPDDGGRRRSRGARRRRARDSDSST